MELRCLKETVSCGNSPCSPAPSLRRYVPCSSAPRLSLSRCSVSVRGSAADQRSGSGHDRAPRVAPPGEGNRPKKTITQEYIPITHQSLKNQIYSRRASKGSWSSPATTAPSSTAWHNTSSCSRGTDGSVTSRGASRTSAGSRRRRWPGRPRRAGAIAVVFSWWLLSVWLFPYSRWLVTRSFPGASGFLRWVGLSFRARLRVLNALCDGCCVRGGACSRSASRFASGSALSAWAPPSWLLNPPPSRHTPAALPTAGEGQAGGRARAAGGGRGHLGRGGDGRRPESSSRGEKQGRGGRREGGRGRGGGGAGPGAFLLSPRLTAFAVHATHALRCSFISHTLSGCPRVRVSVLLPGGG